MSTPTSLPAPVPTMDEHPKLGSQPQGLTSDEASVRLKKDGPNAMPDISVRPIINFLSKFWAPIPWLL
jgi:H+-transporting ATPase